MSDWTSGYVADIGYTFGYYTELNPMRAKLAFLSAGVVAPEVHAACELGFGQGVSINFHAAASNTAWYGTDFNPSQAGFAIELANISGAGAKLSDEAFAEFALRQDLPEFDYIGLHGIWSWISDENRKVIVDFIARKLKVGGVLYVSYNTLPGWAAFAPMRHLMTEHAEIIGAEGRGIISRVNDALEFADKLLATNPNFLRANPLVGERIKQLKGQNRHYLAHEYFNRDWHPMHFATMAEWLKPAKLQYACSANYIDHIDVINFTPEQQALLKEIPDSLFRESVRDFIVNQQFRKDYWIKGLRRMTPLEQAEKFREHKIMLVSHAEDVVYKLTGAAGEVNLSEAVYRPIIEILADHKPKTLGQLEMILKEKGIGIAQVVQAVLILTGAGHVAVVQDDALTAKVKKRTEKLNLHMLNKARSSSENNHLASPVTGGGYLIDRFQQLFLLSYINGRKQIHEWVQFAWDTMVMHNQKLLKEGKTLETEAENLAELTVQAEKFNKKTLPILKALQVV